MGITFDQYIQSPMGSKNAVLSMRDLYRTQYTNKWNDILVRENGDIKYQLLKGKKEYYVYMKIPSEVVDKFYYDVVIMFTPNTKEKKGVESEATLENYDVKFFSNDPSFVFTFAHAFMKKNLFVDDLIDKMPKEVVRNKADERNPLNQIGYVKSLYFTYLEMKRRGLFKKTSFDALAVPYNKKDLLDHITHASEKIAKRQELGQHIEKKKKSIEKSNKGNESGTKRSMEWNNINTKPNRPVGIISAKKPKPTIKPTRKSSTRK